MDRWPDDKELSEALLAVGYPKEAVEWLLSDESLNGDIPQEILAVLSREPENYRPDLLADAMIKWGMDVPPEVEAFLRDPNFFDHEEIPPEVMLWLDQDEDE